jgi:pimeloyl-ACP methyl ester carboxylesterase
MNITPFDKNSVERWRTDMSIGILRGMTDDATANAYAPVIGFTNYDKDIYPYDFKGIHGVTNIVPEFGLLAKYYKDILHRQFQFRYFGILCDYLLTTHGYVPKESLLGLPYDPRLILDTTYRDKYFNDIKTSIETAAATAEKHKRSKSHQSHKITLVGHSLGGVLLKWFLSTYVSAEWIERYLKRIVIVNAPFGGTTMALRVIVSGEYYVPMFHQEFKEALQRMAGILMCLPNEYAYPPLEPLVNMDMPSRLIHVQTMKEIHGLKMPPDSSLQSAFDIWRDLYLPHLPTIMKPLSLGKVPCDIFIGTQQWTVQKINIKREGELPYETAYELGDGQVPTRSLELARNLFVGEHIRTLEVPNSNHIDILSHPLFLQTFD